MFRKKPQVEVIPKWMIVGLGNPGPEYRGTRHNVGFEVIDKLAQRNGIRIERGREKALLGIGSIGRQNVALVKPLTYMNLSGQSVGPLARRYGIKPERILVIADDLDLTVGKVRLKEKGSSGGHNGHKSIIASLQSQEYPRLKIGIGDVDRQETIDHVLSAFSRTERDTVNDSIESAAVATELFIEEGAARTQNYLADYNARFKKTKEDED